MTSRGQKTKDNSPPVNVQSRSWKPKFRWSIRRSKKDPVSDRAQNTTTLNNNLQTILPVSTQEWTGSTVVMSETELLGKTILVPEHGKCRIVSLRDNGLSKRGYDYQHEYSTMVQQMPRRTKLLRLEPIDPLVAGNQTSLKWTGPSTTNVSWILQKPKVAADGTLSLIVPETELLWMRKANQLIVEASKQTSVMNAATAVTSSKWWVLPPTLDSELVDKWQIELLEYLHEWNNWKGKPRGALNQSRSSKPIKKRSNNQSNTVLSAASSRSKPTRSLFGAIHSKVESVLGKQSGHSFHRFSNAIEATMLLAGNDPMVDVELMQCSDFMSHGNPAFQIVFMKLFRVELFVAVANGDIGRVQLLNGLGISLSSKTTDGNNALHIAARHNQSEMLGYLASKGVNVSLKNNQGMEPLHVATLGRSDECCSILLNFGASQTATDNYGRTPTDIWPNSMAWELQHRQMIVSGILENEPNWYSSEFLVLASLPSTSSSHVVHEPENSKSEKGSFTNQRLSRSSRNSRVSSGESTGTLEAMDALLTRHSVDVNTADPATKQTALHIASQYGRVNTVKWLLECKADVSLKDSQCLTPIEHACITGCYEIVCELLHVIQPRSVTSLSDDTSGSFSVPETSRQRHIATSATTVQSLAAASTMSLSLSESEPGTQSAEQSPWWQLNDLSVSRYCGGLVGITSRYGHHKLCHYLLHQGLPLETRDKCGNTPLMLAAIHGHKACCLELLHAGATSWVHNVFLESPLGWAQRWLPGRLRHGVKLRQDQSNKIPSRSKYSALDPEDHSDVARMCIVLAQDLSETRRGLQLNEEHTMFPGNIKEHLVTNPVASRPLLLQALGCLSFKKYEKCFWVNLPQGYWEQPVPSELNGNTKVFKLHVPSIWRQLNDDEVREPEGDESSDDEYDNVVQLPALSEVSLKLMEPVIPSTLRSDTYNYELFTPPWNNELPVEDDLYSVSEALESVPELVLSPEFVGQKEYYFLRTYLDVNQEHFIISTEPAWELLPNNVIRNDVPTTQQMKVEMIRKTRTLSEQAKRTRVNVLNDIFGIPLNPKFTTNNTDNELIVVKMLSKEDAAKRCEQRKCDEEKYLTEMALEGSKYTVFATAGKIDHKEMFEKWLDLESPKLLLGNKHLKNAFGGIYKKYMSTNRK